MKKSALLAILAISCSAGLVADDKNDYPRISFVLPSASRTTVPKDTYLTLVVEGATLSHDDKPIPAEAVVAYVDRALKAQNATSLGVYIREGIKYGDVVKALDVLRKSSARTIGVNMIELPAGRRP